MVTLRSTSFPAKVQLQVNVIDTLGAGDIFHGAFCYYFIQTGEFQQSLEEAAKVAAISCTYRGPRTWMDDRKEQSKRTI